MNTTHTATITGTTAAGTSAGSTVGAARQALFERLMLPQRPALVRLAYHFVRDPDEVEDLVQETLLRAFAGIGTFRPPDPAAAAAPEEEAGRAARVWLFAILRNTYFNAYRRRARRPRTAPSGDAAEEEPAPPEADPARRAVARAEQAAALASLDALPESYRAPILLVHVDGLSYEQAARALALPVGTLRSRIHRGRRRLQRHLAPWQPAAAGASAAPGAPAGRPEGSDSDE